MENAHEIRKRQVALSLKTLQILRNVLADVSLEAARAHRDGPDGWSVLEIVCHLRDFNHIFHQRVLMMRDMDTPALPAYDHEAMARERAYQAQDLTAALEELAESRRALVDTFKALSEAQWERVGIHPERGRFTMTDAALQVAAHDCDHLEQITRVLAGVAMP